MQLRQLGNSNQWLPPIGLGCMGMSEFYGDSNDQASLTLLEQAISMGIKLFDTADTYGNGHNEMLLGQLLKNQPRLRESMLLATKFGIVRRPGDYERQIDNRPEYIAQACEASLKRLGVDCIDLYYCHRRNSEVPIEDMVGAMSRLVEQGKVKMLGLSEVSPQSLVAAHRIHPISAVQSEYSLWSRQEEQAMLPACQKLGVSFVAYSPLGRAFLTGKLQTQQLSANDFRTRLPRLQGDALKRNQSLLQRFQQLTKQWRLNSAQLSLAWILNKYPHTFAIPGTRRLSYLKDNFDATNITLNNEQIEQLDRLFKPEDIAGERYPSGGWAGIERNFKNPDS